MDKVIRECLKPGNSYVPLHIVCPGDKFAKSQNMLDAALELRPDMVYPYSKDTDEDVKTL